MSGEGGGFGASFELGLTPESRTPRADVESEGDAVFRVGNAASRARLATDTVPGNGLALFVVLAVADAPAFGCAETWDGG